MAVEITPRIEEILMLLEKSAQANDRQRFADLVEAIDWSSHQAEELLQTIDLALSLELAALAMKLAQQGGRLFPDHERVQQAAQVLAPPVGRIISQPRVKGLSASQAWFREHAGQYRGQWVAVREGQLLGTAGSLKELAATTGLDKTSSNIIITKVL